MPALGSAPGSLNRQRAAGIIPALSVSAARLPRVSSPDSAPPRPYDHLVNAAKALPTEQTELSLDDRPAVPLPRVSPELEAPTGKRRTRRTRGKVKA